MPLIGIISNCGSTRNKGEMERVRRIVASRPHLFHFEFEEIDAVAQGLKMFADAQVSMIVINGGDGTIQAVLSALMNDRPFDRIPPLAVLPAGKTNMIAADLGARGRPERVLARLLKRNAHAIVKRRLTQRKLIAVDLGDGRPLRYGMFFGTAGVVNGILWCRRKIHTLNLPPGPSHFLAIVGLIASTLRRKKRSPLLSGKILLVLGNGERLEGQFSMVLATTLNRLLLGLKPYGTEGIGGLKCAMVTYGAAPLIRGAVALLMGRFSRGGMDGVQVRRTDRMRIEGAEPFTLDGEIYFPHQEHPVAISSTKENLTFVKP